ncbi:MAG: hypothetical protein AAB795_03735 [Patescibacteria group bacterium]
MRLLINQIIDFWGLFGAFWYILAPVGLFFVFRLAWLGYVRGHFLSNIKWVLLEIQVTRDVAKSPKAMENIFAGLHGATRSIDLIHKYWEGIVLPWFSLEIVGDDNGVHFYIWTQEFFRRLVEAQVYAQYPSSEIRVVEDYTKLMPKDLPDDQWTLWGAELELTKPDAYPIRTYEEFTLEDISAKEEERKIDPLSSMVEFFGALKAGERCWVQVLIRPTGDAWKKEGDELMGQLMGKTTKAKKNFIQQIFSFINEVVSFFLPQPAQTIESPKKEDFGIFKLSPGQQDVIKAVEKNISKLGFETGIRWMYIARHDTFSFVGVSAINGIFKQFSSQSLNGFKLNAKTKTTSGYLGHIERFKNIIEDRKKSRIYRAYRMRSLFYPPFNQVKPFVLSSSELATVYHFPGTVVGAPAMTRVEAKKGTPPSNLPL